MPVRLALPMEKEFILERTDLTYENEGEPSKVLIRQATQAEHERRSFVYSEVTNVINANRNGGKSPELQLRQAWSMEELKRLEVYLTLKSCNLLDENGKDIFHFKTLNGRSELDMQEHQFNEAWGKLPPEVALEIHEKVLEVNVMWGGPLGS